MNISVLYKMMILETNTYTYYSRIYQYFKKQNMHETVLLKLKKLII